jgi:hypothetical protein
VPTLPQVLKTVKELKLKGGTSLWIVHRYVAQRIATYSVLRVEAEDKLKKKLRDIARSAIDEANAIAPYDYVTDDQDDGQVFAVGADEAGFGAIQKEIESGGEAPLVTTVDDLTSAWAYVAKINADGNEPIYAFRRLSTSWSTKKVGGGPFGINSFFDSGMLVDLDDRQIFRIDRRVDFFVHAGTLFILNKRQFEVGMNFREGMERHRDEVLQEFTDLELFSDVGVFRAVIQDNMKLLRRIATVRKNGYYKDPEFIAKLQQRAVELGWPIEIVDSKIVVNDQNVELVLRFINNDRLQSPINDEVFDVSVKRLVTS